MLFTVDTDRKSTQEEFLKIIITIRYIVMVMLYEGMDTDEEWQTQTELQTLLFIIYHNGKEMFSYFPIS